MKEDDTRCEDCKGKKDQCLICYNKDLCVITDLDLQYQFKNYSYKGLA
jgi:hypothetical protein